MTEKAKSLSLVERYQEAMRYLRKTWPNFLLLVVLTACASDVEKASKDCLIQENKAACSFIDQEKKVYRQEEKVEEIEKKIQDLEKELKAAQEELEELEKNAEEAKDEWEASKNPPVTNETSTPTSTP